MGDLGGEQERDTFLHGFRGRPWGAGQKYENDNRQVIKRTCRLGRPTK